MNFDEELNLDDFTDVVTLYKCKFCHFTDSSKVSLTKHIKGFHLPSNVQKVNESTSTSSGSGDVTVETGNEQKAAINQNDKIDPEAESKLSPDESSAVKSNNGTDPDLVVNDDNTQSTERWDIVEQAAVTALQGYLTNNTTQTGDDSLVNSESKELTISTNDEQYTVDDAGDDVTYRNIEVSHPQHIVISDSLIDPTNNQVTTDDSNVDGSNTKELYLCGQCNEVFSTINDCKQHMVDDHELVLNEDVCLSPKVSVGGKMMVDASIQTLAKKPGRKRKLVNTVLEPETVEEKQFLDSDDETNDAENVVEEETIEGSVAQGKRKIKTPRALKSDYQFSRSMLRIARRTNTERVRKNREFLSKYNVSCDVAKCNAKFTSEESLEIHRRCHGDKTSDYRCYQCADEKFKTWKTCQIHLYRKHDIDTDLFSCSQCGYKCNSMSKLQTHLEIHGDDRNYQCHVCGYQFKQLAGLRVHHSKAHSLNDVDIADIPIVSNLKSTSMKQCLICQRTLMNSRCLSKHMQEVHKTDKMFSCDLCDYTCSRKHMLKLHLRTHTGEKPFKCDQCPFASADHNSLRRHKMRHSGRRPYVCPYCPYSCIQSVSFKGHMLSKHPGLDGLFACHFCSYQSVKKESLENHLNDHNNGIVKNTRKVKQRQEENKQQSVIQFQQGQTTPSIPGLSDADAAQLIYSALNVIQEKAAQGDDTAQSFTLQIPCSTQDDNLPQTVYFAVHPSTDVNEETTNTCITTENNNSVETGLLNTNQVTETVTAENSESIYLQNVESLTEMIAESGKTGTVVFEVQGTGGGEVHMIELQEETSV